MAVGQRRNVVFSSKRCVINWGGFSQVKATLALLSAAWRFDRPFHRFCLLSGSDYPIKPNLHITDAFESTKQFMRVDRSLGASETNTHTDYVRFYWFNDSWDTVRRRGGRVRRRPRRNLTLYQGSQWWALTRDCVGYVFEFLSSNRGFNSFFRYTHCSDEIFFHSIVKQSPFAADITHDFETAPDLGQYFSSNDHGCHYIDWNAKEERLPKVLDLTDIEKLLGSSCLFARKFEERRSGPLVAELDRILAN
jgi:hypothetical protein